MLAGRLRQWVGENRPSRGLSELVLAGIDAPERLLFADEADLRSIARLDEVALEEIARYRAEFAGPRRQPTWRPVFSGLGGIFVSQQKPQGARRESSAR